METTPKLSRLPLHLTKNAPERARQGTLAQAAAARDRSKLAAGGEQAGGRYERFEEVALDDLGGGKEHAGGRVQGGGRRRRWKAAADKWMVNDSARVLFYGTWVFLNLLVLAFASVHYALKDNLVNARQTFGSGLVVARASALVLQVNAVFIMFPMCRNFISLLRRTPLNHIIPFDKNVEFHVQVAWSIVLWSIVHTVAHMANFARLAVSTSSGFVGFLRANFTTGPGVTGWAMWTALGVMLLIIFFALWQLHGMFCMIKPDRPPYCSFMSTGVFWKFWLPGGLLYISERILREIRGRHRTYVSKVIAHPSNVCEVQIKKEHINIRAGQYIMLNCPEVSYFQYHPFTLTSAPEEDYISVHLRVVGDWTTAFTKALGCDFSQVKPDEASKANDPGPKDRTSKRQTTVAGPAKEEKLGGGDGEVVQLPLHRNMPRIMVDGPFGSASEDFSNYETVLLVGAGIGVTPFASILKTIWYRMNNYGNTVKTRLSRVYLVWVIRDFGSAEWFHSLLHAIEEQDFQRRIEISIYLTAKLEDDDMNNIVVQDVGADKDAITSLRAPTYFGRPNWDQVFQGISDQHPDTDVGVFFCGPPALGTQLHLMSNKYTGPDGTRFFFGKENF